MSTVNVLNKLPRLKSGVSRIEKPKVLGCDLRTEAAAIESSLNGLLPETNPTFNRLDFQLETEHRPDSPKEDRPPLNTYGLLNDESTASGDERQGLPTDYHFTPSNTRHTSARSGDDPVITKKQLQISNFKYSDTEGGDQELTPDSWLDVSGALSDSASNDMFDDPLEFPSINDCLSPAQKGYQYRPVNADIVEGKSGRKRIENGSRNESENYYQDLDDSDFLEVLDGHFACLQPSSNNTALNNSQDRKISTCNSNEYSVIQGFRLVAEESDEFPEDSDLFDTILKSNYRLGIGEANGIYPKYREDVVQERPTTRAGGLFPENSCPVGGDWRSEGYNAFYPKELEVFGETQQANGVAPHDGPEENLPEAATPGNEGDPTIFSGILCPPEQAKMSGKSKQTATTNLSHYQPLPLHSQSFQLARTKSCESNISTMHVTGNMTTNLPKAFVRSGFPLPVRQQSPIQGLTPSHTLLRTCFRIGEALKVGLASHRLSPHLVTETTTEITGSDPHRSRIPKEPTSTLMLIELYAFVTRSYRIGSRQYFSFSDLFFPFQPPYLTGYWECWESNSYYNEDGRAFLGPGGREWQRARFSNGKAVNNSRAQGHPPAFNEETAGRMCRAIGTLTTNTSFLSRRSPKQTVSSVENIALKVLSIRSATWQDVEYVKGIVQP